MGNYVKRAFKLVRPYMGGGQLKRGKSTFWSKFILLIHLTDHSDVHKVSLITKITKIFEFPPF